MKYDFSALPELTNSDEKMLPWIVLYDTSGSLHGYEQAIRDGLQALKDAIIDDDMARARVDLCLIEFNTNVEIKQNFTSAVNMEIPEVVCQGMTATHEAIRFAIDLANARKKQYKANGSNYCQPWVWLITDGASNDFDNGSFHELLEMQKNQKCVFFCVAMGDNVHMDELRAMHKDNIVLHVSQEGFREVFEYIGQTMVNASSLDPVYRRGMVVPDPNSGIKITGVVPRNGMIPL